MSLSGKQQKYIFEMPIMSWERPIEVALLEWVRSMITSFEATSLSGAEHYLDAYRTTEREILREIKIREKLK